MSVANYEDALSQLRAAGLLVSTVETDTPRPVRCRVEGGGREKRGWYWATEFHASDAGETYIVGTYGVWHGNDNGAQKIKLSMGGKKLSKEERDAIAARHREASRQAKAQRAAAAKRAAGEAARVWSAYVETGDSDYLKRKGVGAYGIRFDPKGHGTVVVPMKDARGQVHGLQIVRGSNRGNKLEKQYWPRGLQKTGRYHLIGGVTSICLLAEGYATAATIHEATGLPVAVAFDANNLMPVGKALRERYPKALILVCADDDFLQKCRECGEKTPVAEPTCQHCGQPHGQTNPGIDAARLAATAVAGEVIWPIFPGDRGRNKLTDFNDLQHFPNGGQHLVRAQIEQRLKDLGWDKALTSATQRVTPPEGAGEGRRRAVSVMEIDDAVRRFVPLDDGTGKYLFDQWTNKIVQKEQMTSLLEAGVRWDDVKRHPEWVRRGAYYLDEVGFDPTGEDPGVHLNTWKGWPLQPSEEGSCEAMLSLLRYLCSNEGPEQADKVFDWLIKWMAYPLQNPGAKMSSAVIMHGPQGTGKSAVFSALAEIYGDYSTVLNQRGLEDKFNADWVDSKLFILAEEVVTRAEMWHIKNELKELITGKYVRVNPKNVAAYRQRNQINIVYLSNEGQPLPLEDDDRRHLVIWTPPALEEDLYDQVFVERQNGGIEAFYHYLLNVDLAGFHPAKRPPMTGAKQDLIQVSKPSEQRFIREWMDGETDYPFGPCEGRQLYAAYSRWCRENGVRNPRESNQFLGYVTRQDGWKNQPCRLFNNSDYRGDTVRRRMILPANFVLEERGATRPPDKTNGQWLTDCVLRMGTALNGGEL